MVLALGHTLAAVVAVRGRGLDDSFADRDTVSGLACPRSGAAVTSSEFPAVGVAGGDPEQGWDVWSTVLALLSCLLPLVMCSRSGQMLARPKAATEVLGIGSVGVTPFPCPGLCSSDRPGAPLRRKRGGRMQPAYLPSPGPQGRRLGGPRGAARSTAAHRPV